MMRSTCQALSVGAFNALSRRGIRVLCLPSVRKACLADAPDIVSSEGSANLDALQQLRSSFAHSRICTSESIHQATCLASMATRWSPVYLGYEIHFRGTRLTLAHTRSPRRGRFAASASEAIGDN